MAQTITICQTQDPYVTDVQYIAYRKLTLDPNGELDCEALSKLGLGEPGEKFWIVGYPTSYLVKDTLPAEYLFDDCMKHDAELGPVVVVCGYQDNLHARKRFKDRLDAEEHAELMERLQRVPAIRAWNYVTSSISRAVSDLKLPRLSQIRYSLTCWRRRRMGDYGYLEAIYIMEEEKEYWEAFHKSQREVRA